jgi:hypothetical protein
VADDTQGPGASLRVRLPLVVALVTTVGCGGGVPLLHPARALGTGEVRAAAGVSGNFVPATLGTELNAARAEAGNLMGPPPDDPKYAKGALIAAALGPGLAPYVSARAGIGAQFEAGIIYSGRSARIDARRSWNWGDVSLSLGAGLSYVFYGDEGASALPYVDLDSIHGFGADLPVLVGWQSSARLFMAWAGVRGGWEHASISALSSVPSALTMPEVELTATRFYAGGLAGAAAGFRHVHVALELDASYETVSGMYVSAPVTVSGLALTPAAALWVDF